MSFILRICCKASYAVLRQFSLRTRRLLRTEPSYLTYQFVVAVWFRPRLPWRLRRGMSRRSLEFRLEVSDLVEQLPQCDQLRLDLWPTRFVLVTPLKSASVFILFDRCFRTQRTAYIYGSEMDVSDG